MEFIGLSDSIDGKPLATTIPQMFTEFPYDRVSENNLMAWVTKPECVAQLLAFYLISKPTLNYLASTFEFDSKSRGFRRFVALHNLALAIFSAVVFFSELELVIEHMWKNGIDETYCDRSRNFWAAGHGFWSILFYLSKYWEFIDTWILVLKGKKVSFLQVYHHTGMIVAMWAGVVCQSPWLFTTVILNSFIHTFMYTYFFVKTLYPSMKIPAAKYLTRAQISQFYIGLLIGKPYFFKGDGCDTRPSRLGLGILQGYVYGLVALFLAFAAKKYNGKEKDV